MNELTIINQNGQLVVDSREVAHMVDKEHKNLLRDIKGYCIYLNSPANMMLGSKLSAANFFIESTYKNENNQEYPCYLLTKKGCDMVANKMTGEKGVLFTAAYVTKFEEMENALKPSCIEDVMILSLQEMKAIKQQLNEVNYQALQAQAQSAEAKQEIQSMRDVITLSPNSWRQDTTKLINAIAQQLGGFDHIKNVREESYKLLNERYGVDVITRLTNKRRRMADEGVCKSKRDKLTVLDVIADDKKLIEGYVAIVKVMAIKYKAA